jgi:dihydrofolate synthase/folylpolyglutamate synthase
MRNGCVALATPREQHDALDRTLADALSRLDALVDWERGARTAMRVDLEPVRDLLARLGNPHRRLRIVHITGTKGKGSVCALIEAGLLHAGLRAGRYASPHVQRVNERVSVLGRPIDDGSLASALGMALDALDAARSAGTQGGAATWFDAMTAAAFFALADAGLEWAVIEVGLGGRLDSTNVVLPELAILTNIGLEHCDVLGATREAIAAEKAGIVKRGRPVLTTVSADDGAGYVIAAQAHALGAPLHRVEIAGLAGVARANLLLARRALTLLGDRGVHSPRRNAPLDADDLPPWVADGARLPGRLEAFSITHDRRRVHVVLDGAHVDFALQAVFDELHLDPRHAAAPVVLFALGADKNAAAMVRVLAGVASHVLCTRLAGGRACVPPRDLQQLCATAGLASDAIEDPRAALELALAAVDDAGWLLVTGSLHLAGSVRPTLVRLMDQLSRRVAQMGGRAASRDQDSQDG